MEIIRKNSLWRTGTIEVLPANGSARFTGSRPDHRSRGGSLGPDHQRQGTPGRGRWERVCHIGGAAVAE